MADTQVIKNFIVSLGFKTDEAALKKFADGIGDATNSVMRLAVSVTAAATAVAIGVERFANNMNQLYFAAIRTATSATHIKAFQRTIMDFGGSAEDAMASIEGLTTFMRNNPGGGAWINQWLAGVGKKMTGDKAIDLASIGEVFAKNTREGNAYLNDQLARKWGISSATALEIQMPGFGKAQADISARLDKAGFGKATADAAAFVRQLNEMRDWLTIIGTKVLDVLQNKLGLSMGKLNAYLQANGDAIAGKIAHGVEIFIKFLDVVATVIGAVIKAMMWLDQVTGGLSTTIATIIGLLYVFGGFGIIKGIWSMADAILGVTKGWRAAAAAAEAATVATTVARGVAAAGHIARAEAAGAEVLRLEQVAFDASTLAESGAAMKAANAQRVIAQEARAAGLAEQAAVAGVAGRVGLMGALGVGARFVAGRVVPAVGALMAGYEGGKLLADVVPESAHTATDWLANKRGGAPDLVEAGNPNAGPMKLLMGLGWSAEQAAGIIGNLQVESDSDRLNPNVRQKGGGPGYGIAQWEGPRQAAFKKWSGGHDIHGSSREQQLRFVDWELRHSEKGAGDAILGSASAADAAHYMSTLYERPNPSKSQEGLRIAKAERLLKGMHLEQKTIIQIAGNVDKSTVAEIERAQDRVNAKTIRDMNLGVM